MKSKGPELGSISSGFFAYARLKKLDIVRIGEIAPILDISASQERDLFRRLSNSGWIVRLKRGIYLVPPRIPIGGKYSPGSALILQKIMVEKQAIYGNMATIRRIGYLLDTLGLNPKIINRLQRQLSTSNPLIPLIPGRSARGAINHKWGIIVNG